ncbi:MAG TPA: peptidoglycan-associated lipoprotein Pal [Steroidobacteraceae bacterium]|jgi:peptidoglycan-associated lipoprotein|nr:peptidoglycan-associated lipoprotein Pal [Steroidobacteraceae bacterium]
MKRIISIALLIAGAALLAGCPKKHNVNDTPVAGTQVPDSAGSNAGDASTSTSPLGGDANNSSRGINGEGTGPLARKIIYFDFDKSEIKPEFADIVTTTAHVLTANPKIKLKLEGNTDERGTREYNIGLGERRSQAVRRALMLQGVAESQVSTVSFGSERPAAEGDDEAAWAKNRRVEVVFLP